MKESLLCNVLVFLADTPKSAGRHVIQGKPEMNERNTAVIIYFTNVATQTKLSACTIANWIFAWNICRMTSWLMWIVCVCDGSRLSQQADAQAPLWVCYVTGQHCLLWCNAVCHFTERVSSTSSDSYYFTASAVVTRLCTLWAAAPDNAAVHKRSHVAMSAVTTQQ